MMSIVMPSTTPGIKVAKIGDVVEFKRNDMTIRGKVSIIRELSCIVEIPQDIATALKYETPRTVVRHGNYKIIENITA